MEWANCILPIKTGRNPKITAVPDQKQIEHGKQILNYEEHIKHLERIDSALEIFCQSNGFLLEKNQWHRPCRVLRKPGNPSYLIEISQEGDWKKVVYRENLPHSVYAAGYLVNEKQGSVYQMNAKVAYFEPFSTIQSNLEDFLNSGVRYIVEWTAEIIKTKGRQSRHPSCFYRERGGYKVESPD